MKKTSMLHLKMIKEIQKGLSRFSKKMDSRGIEPRTTPMLREYYTTKPQAQLNERLPEFRLDEPKQLISQK